MANSDGSFTIETLGDQRHDQFHILYGYCRNRECDYSAPLNLEALIARKGEDFRLKDLHAILICKVCKKAGRNWRNCRFHYSCSYASRKSSNDQSI